MDYRFTPFGDNKLETREDVQKAFLDLFKPLLPGFSKGKAEVCLQLSGAHFDLGAAYLEGFSRPLWGIVPFALGGGDFPYWDIYREGLVNGCDPKHPEYWGDCFDCCQNLVDLAAIGYALAFVPHLIWEPLTKEGKEIVGNYLLSARNSAFWNCNWKFFRLIIDLGLEKVGIEHDQKSHDEYIKDINGMYLDDGWYCDGDTFKIDYYNPFAFQFYGIVYGYLKDTPDSKVFASRAKDFALQFQHWFGDDGSNLPFGRSLTYRFASAAFWGCLPLICSDEKGEPPISWGAMKGLYLKNLQWWSKQPISILNSNILSVGYSYPNIFMGENYNSPESPYWSFKAFAALMLPESHPFWATKAEFPKLDNIVEKVPGMLISHHPGNTVALVSGPCHNTVRYQAEKYCKFAYSTRYGFSVENSRQFSDATLDSMIGFSFSNNAFFVREANTAFLIDGGLYSEWTPTEGIEVKTWLIQGDGYHIRVHEIDNSTSKEVQTIEGGFAVSGMSPAGLKPLTDGSVAQIENETDVSVIIDHSPVSRTPKVVKPDPNTNLIFSKVWIPRLQGTILANSSAVFSSIVYAQPKDGQTIELSKLREIAIPDLESLKALTKKKKPVVCNA